MIPCRQVRSFEQERVLCCQNPHFPESWQLGAPLRGAGALHTSTSCCVQSVRTALTRMHARKAGLQPIQKQHPRVRHVRLGKGQPQEGRGSMPEKGSRGDHPVDAGQQKALEIETGTHDHWRFSMVLLIDHSGRKTTTGQLNKHIPTSEPEPASLCEDLSRPSTQQEQQDRPL